MEQIARSAKQVGAIIRRYRRNKGLTQNDISEKIRIRQATVSRLETGEYDTSLRTIFDVLAALDLEITIRERSKFSKHDIEDML
ncbi:MAG: transcriptional regulator [Alphaproteobacteria bacterium]|nr:MAG: transcriptional regulator [Alphaproteobacteria bacterium]